MLTKNKRHHDLIIFRILASMKLAITKIINSTKFIGRFSILLVIVFFVFYLQSCVKDNFELDKLVKTEWDANLAVPLVYSSLTIGDIIKSDPNSLVVVGSDNFCTLKYKGNLFSLPASRLMNIPNQPLPTIVASLTPTQINTLSSQGSVTASFSQLQTFSFGTGSKIDSVVFKSGSIHLNLNSDFRKSGSVKISIPAARKNGVAFSKTIPFVYSGTIPVIVNDSSTLDFSGYTFDMTNGGTTFNQFLVNYSITLSGGGASPTTLDQIDISQTMSGMKFSRLYGDLGQLPLVTDADTIDISIFKSALGTGSFTLIDPKITFKFSNSIGAPIAASVTALEGYNPGLPPYIINGSPNPLPIFSPNFNQIGQTLTSSFSLDKTNSNVVPFINDLPKYLLFKMNAQTNPAGATHHNFVTDSSQLKVDLELDLPLYGTAKDFVLVDTIPFTVGEQVASDVDWAMIRAYTLNGFPLDIGMQVYFVDSSYIKLDSLVIPNQLILKSAHLNTSTGLVTSPTENIYDGKMTNNRLMKIIPTKYIIIKSVAETANNGNTNVKIYANYKLDVRLGIQVKFKKKI